MRKSLKILFATILFPAVAGLGGFGGWGAYAQSYPVQLTPIFNTPYSVKLSDYANSMDTKMQLLINPTDFSITQRQVRLKLIVQGNGINAQSSQYIQGQNPVYINGGELQTLTNVDIAALFRLENLEGLSAVQYANPLPEGMYNFCFEMYDVMSNQRLSQKSCAMMYLQLNDPPLLNIPAKNEQIAATDFPNILFTWTPRQINATNVSYIFELKEILDPNLDPQFAFQMSPLLYQETDLRSTALLYNLGMPTLIPGKKYAWRIKAISTSGLSENAVFKNDGYSEIFYFKYATNCSAPTFLLSEAQSAKSAKITWQSITASVKFHVQYRTKGVARAEWFSVYTQNDQTTLTDLESGAAYEFRVGATCDPIQYGVEQSYVYSPIQELTMPAKGSDDKGFNCGIVPSISLTNQTPLTNLIVSETFTAGDFPVKVLELTGQNPYTGRGYIVVPYLADTKIAVQFTNITINTDYKLINGVVETTYDPNGVNIVDVDPLIEEIFGSQTGTETVDTTTTTDDSTTEEDTDQTDINANSGSDTDTESDTDSNNDGVTDTETNTNTNTTTTTTENNSDTNESNSGTNITDNDYFIEYKGAKYFNGGKIQIPYKRSMSEVFEMKTLANDAKVDWTIHEVGKQELWRSYAGYTIKATLPIEEPSPTLVNLLKLDLEANAVDIEGKPKVRIGIEKIVTPFTQTGLTVKQHTKPERIAKAGETLYFINKPDKKYRIVFEESINPNLDINGIPKEFLKWSSSGKYLTKYSGERIIGKEESDVFFANEKIDFTMTSSAGYPTLTNKNVSVKWVDEDFKQDKFAFKYEGLDKILQLTDKLKEKLKIPVYARGADFNKDQNFSIYVEPSYKNERKNIESATDRLYYKETKNTIEIEIGAKGKIEKPVPYLAIPPFDDKICGIQVKFELGLYWFVEASVTGELGATKYTTEWIEKTSKNKSTWSYGDPSEIVLGATFGLNPKIVLEMPGVKGEASGKTSTKIDFLKYDFKKKEASCPLLTEGIKGTITPVTELEIAGFSYSHQWDKIECVVKIP